MAPFCSCPASLVSRTFFAVGPGVQSVCFFCAPSGAATFRRGQSKKKNTTQGVFFLLRPRGKAGEGEAPLGAGTGCCGPLGRSLTNSLGPGRPSRIGQGVLFFFVVAPFCSCPASLVSRTFFAVGPGCAKCFFFLLRSVGRRDLSAGPEHKKKHHPGLFFCSGPGERQGKEKPHWAPARVAAARSDAHLLTHFGPGRPSRRARPKKKHPGWCLFFLLRPRADAHSLTAGLGGDASARRGHSKKKTPRVAFLFFLLRPRADAHSLTAGLGSNASARRGHTKKKNTPGGAFFLLRPRRVFLDNSKKCLGYYIGSKKARRGHSKKNNTTSLLNFKNLESLKVGYW